MVCTREVLALLGKNKFNQIEWAQKLVLDEQFYYIHPILLILNYGWRSLLLPMKYFWIYVLTATLPH